MKGAFPHAADKAHEEQVEPGSRLVFFAGLAALLLVPIFKTVTGLPPFMGMLLSVGLLWFLTDVLHAPHETRQHLRLPEILRRVDTSGVLFFLGILLCIGALENAGLLGKFSQLLEDRVGNVNAIAVLIGLISAVIDNVPVVAAAMGMWNLSVYPADSSLWQMISLCAGTGGSILLIGSAAGIAFMAMEKVDFLWYMKKVSWIALIGYFAGVGTFFLQSLLF